MCIGGSSTPAPPAQVPEAPTMPDTSTRTILTDDKKRRAAATGVTGTILTGPRGVTQQGATATKTLLGE